MDTPFSHRPYLFQRLEQDRFWLAKHPGMEDWDAGCRRIATHLENEIACLSSTCCGEAWAPGSEKYPELLVLLWERWAHAWFHIFVRGRTRYDFETVLNQSLQKGLGWDWTPHFRDVLMVIAYHHFQDNRAFEIIDRENTEKLVASLQCLVRFRALLQQYDTIGANESRQYYFNYIYKTYAKWMEKGTWKNYAGIGPLIAWMKETISRFLQKEKNETFRPGETGTIRSDSDETGTSRTKERNVLPNPKLAVSFPEQDLPDPQNPLSAFDRAFLRDCREIHLRVLGSMEADTLAFLMFYRRIYLKERRKITERIAAEYGFNKEFEGMNYYKFRDKTIGQYLDLFMEGLRGKDRSIREEINNPEGCREAVKECLLSGVFWMKKQRDEPGDSASGKSA